MCAFPIHEKSIQQPCVCISWIKIDSLACKRHVYDSGPLFLAAASTDSQMN